MLYMKTLKREENNVNKSLNNRVIWICGAKTGIGLAMAKQFIEKGARLCVSSRDGQVVKELEGQVKALKCDAKSMADWQLCAKEITEEFGKLDVFVYNAGDCIYVDDVEIKAEDFETMMDINFHGMVKASQVVLPLLKKSQSAQFVGMASSVAWLALPRAEAYGSSKAAAHYFLKSLRLDLSQYGIDVSIICPGFVKTPMTDKNDFPMPFLVSSERAGREICQGIIKRKPVIHFPKRFTYLVKFIAALPHFLEFRICRSFAK